MVVNEMAKDIIEIEVTTAEWQDSEVLPDVLAQVDVKVCQVYADGAYDSDGTHATICQLEALATIPPRQNAAPWRNGHPRDAHLAEIAATERAVWNEASGYHRRSIAESMCIGSRNWVIDSSPLHLTSRWLRATFGQPSSISSCTAACRSLSAWGILGLRYDSR